MVQAAMNRESGTLILDIMPATACYLGLTSVTHSLAAMQVVRPVAMIIFISVSMPAPITMVATISSSAIARAEEPLWAATTAQIIFTSVIMQARLISVPVLIIYSSVMV